MATTQQQNVTIKGTKDGLSLYLNDNCPFSEVLEDLKAKLLINKKFKDESQKLSVRIHTGNRLLTESQIADLKSIVAPNKNLLIESIESNVMLKDEAERLIRQSETHIVNQIIRSGQVLEVDGDLLLISDVNPGGTVVASGNIFIMGSLNGVAHAGFPNNRDAVVCAAQMNPTQIRIAEFITRAPDDEPISRESAGGASECAYVDSENQIVIDKIQVLKSIRPSLNRFVEGRE